MRRIAIGCLFMLLAGLAAPARADLVIYVQDTNVQVGGYGLLNVYLGSTNPAQDVFDTYNVILSITPIAPAAGTVSFAPNGAAPDPNNTALGLQPYSYLFPSGSTASNYIFPNGDSVDSFAGVNGGDYVPGQASTYFAATDGSLSGMEYGPAKNTPGTTLLTSLLIKAVSTNVSEQYLVSVVTTSVTGGLAPTLFLNNSAPVPFSQDASQMGYTGTITIVPATIPEPASVVSGLTAWALLAGFHCVRRHQQSTARRRSSTE